MAAHIPNAFSILTSLTSDQSPVSVDSQQLNNFLWNVPHVLPNAILSLGVGECPHRQYAIIFLCQ
jgi:hypothetical protein